MSCVARVIALMHSIIAGLLRYRQCRRRGVAPSGTTHRRDRADKPPRPFSTASTRGVEEFAANYRNVGHMAARDSPPREIVGQLKDAFSPLLPSAAALIEGVEFASDSLLEGPGFEPSVPRPR